MVPPVTLRRRNIKEVQDTGFLSSAPTLAVQQIDADALLQVHPQGIRHVLSEQRVNKWRVLEMVYFGLDLDGQLMNIKRGRRWEALV